MECAGELGVVDLLMASTLSVYGANEEMPYSELHKVDAQMTIYAATKMATEAMPRTRVLKHRCPLTRCEISNPDKVRLMDIVEAIETNLGKSANLNYMKM